MKRLTFGLGVIVAGLALAASPALAQRPSESGSGSPHTGGGMANSGGGGGGSTAAPSSVAVPSSSGISSGSSGGGAMSSPSAGAGMSPSMSGASASAPRQAAPVHRAGWTTASQSRFTGAQRVVTGSAVPRNDSTPVAGSGYRVPPGSAGTGAVPSWARPRGGNASNDTAVPRTTPRPQPGTGLAYIYSDPYGCYRYLYCGGAYGYGGYGYYDFYDPFYGSIYSPLWGFGMGMGLGGYPVFDPGFGYASGDEYNYGVGSYSPSSSHEEGNLKLKVKPRSAKVYVDGYFVGLVDEFDGMFQKLPLTAGRHHVKIQADGYETEEFDAVITPQQTVTFQGTLKKLQ